MPITSEMAICEKACSEGDAEACAILSTYFRSERGDEKNRMKALEFQERACELDHTASCLTLAELNKMNGDLQKALKYYQKACSLGVQICCEWAQKLQSDEFKCLSLPYADATSCERACGQRNAACCLKRGEIAQLSNNSKIGPLALEYYKKACDLESHLGCYYVGHYYWVGADTANRDIWKTISYFERACSLRPPLDQAGQGYDLLMWEISTSCFMLALIFCEPAKNAPQGAVEQDVEKAIEYFSRSCELGVAFACRVLGEMYESGEYIEPDVELSKKYHERACRLGEKRSCASPQIKMRAPPQ